MIARLALRWQLYQALRTRRKAREALSASARQGQHTYWANAGEQARRMFGVEA